MAGIRQLLLRAGLPENDMPREDDRAAMIAATIKWLVTTKDGQEYHRRLFCVHGRRGDDDKDYAVIDNINNQIHTVVNTDVWLFEGALVRGVMMPVSNPSIEHGSQFELDINDKERKRCDGCGTSSHCIKTVTDPFDERMKDLCNYCITYHEHTKVNSDGGLKNCELCTVHGCKHHPERRAS